MDAPASLLLPALGGANVVIAAAVGLLARRRDRLPPRHRASFTPVRRKSIVAEQSR